MRLWAIRLFDGNNVNELAEARAMEAVERSEVAGDLLAAEPNRRLGKEG
jgi:hypothetical protein